MSVVRAALPLLRSPPFPGVPPEVAAVSYLGRATTPSPARIDALVEQIRAARVGGTFWAPPGDAGGHARPTSDRDPWSVLGPGTELPADADNEWRMIACIAGAEVEQPDLTALFGGTVYRNPFTGAAIEAEQAVDILAEWRRLFDENRSIAVASGMAWWKRPAIERFLWTGRARPLRFEDHPVTAVKAAQKAGGAVACWPAKAPSVIAQARDQNVPVIAIEDGFVRSVGLGAALHPPLSIVIDRGGIYYDPASGSDLERLLETAPMPPDLLARAAAIRRTIVERGIGKYASTAPSGHAVVRTRRTVLVAGQVEDDASVRLGGGGVASNLELLRRAREAEPEALILFKPHPDVDAGHRRGRVADTALLAHADQVIRGEPMSQVFERVDAVHVLSSLTGFEALLRELEVIVHGQPFFADWGLTRDLGPPLPNRTRRLTIDMLVAGALILYPRYLDPVTGLPCPPEILLDRLAEGWRPGWSPVIALRGLQGRLARLLGTWTSGPVEKS